MKRRSSTEYVSKLLTLIESSNVEQMNQALTLLEPAFDGGLLTQVEFKNLSNTLVAEFYNFCKTAKKMLKWGDWSDALVFGLELVNMGILSQRDWDLQEEQYLERVTNAFQFYYSLRGLREAKIKQYKPLVATTADGKFKVETYRYANLCDDSLRASFSGAAIYEGRKTIHPDIRVSGFVEVRIPPVESIYQTEEEYFSLITKEMRRLDKELEGKFKDLVENKKEFNKVLKRNMIMASFKSVVAKYIKGSSVGKILNLVETGDLDQAELLGEALYGVGQISKKDWQKIQVALLAERIKEADLDYDDRHGGLALSIKDSSLGDVDFYIPLQMRYGAREDHAIVVLEPDFDRGLEVIPHDHYDHFMVGDYMWLDSASVESTLTFDLSDKVKDIESKLYKERLRLEKVFQKKAIKILERKLKSIIRNWAY